MVFLECTIGYFAKNCELRCPYPSYGEECQAICTCPKVTCDFVYGCTKRTRAGNTFSSFFFNQIEKTSLKNVPNDIHLNYSKFLDLIFKTTCFLSLNKNGKRRSKNMLTLLVFSTENTSITPPTTEHASARNLTTVPLGLLQEDDTNTYSRIPYKWLFITSVPLCIIFGIVIACLLFEKYRNRRDIETMYIEYNTPTNQHVPHVYDLCTAENEHGRRQSLVDNSSATTSANIYLTVVERVDPNV